MKVVTIIQARTTSKRLPNKVMLDIYGKPLLERVIDQALKIKNSDEVWVATSTHENDDVIEYLCERKEMPCFRGSLSNVRGRYYTIAKNQNADIIVRITADNPFTEPFYAEELINFLKESPEYDYARVDKSTSIDGTQSEAFTMDALEHSIQNYDDDQNREHVTAAMIFHMKIHELVTSNKELLSENSYFVGVDTFADYKKATLLFRKFGEQNTLKKIIKELNKNGKAI